MIREHRPPSPVRRVGLALAAALALSVACSCQLLLESRTEQCQADTDCSNGLTCDKASHLCVGDTTSTSSSSSSSTSSASSTSSSGSVSCNVDGGPDAAYGGCWNCAPSDSVPNELYNHCTTAACVPFDRARLTHLTDAGTLPPLPVPPDAGDGG
jgi:hypothetical protein